MALPSLQSLLIIGTCLIACGYAQLNARLVGTWTSKSWKVLTGPVRNSSIYLREQSFIAADEKGILGGTRLAYTQSQGFYDPNNDSFIEPRLTGISYSFTSDGFYEEAYYRAVSNPTNPSCSEAVLQFQHGTVSLNADNSLSLNPFAVDGRQLVSNPCAGSTSAYKRYNQSEVMNKWQVYTDPYTQMTRLDLYKFDGSPMIPMFYVASVPVINPTTTMNPITVATATATGKAKRQLRDKEVEQVPLNTNPEYTQRTMAHGLLERVEPHMLWWAGVGMVISGVALYVM